MARYRNSFSGKSPSLTKYDIRNPRYDEKYSNIPGGALPQEESL